MLTINVIEDFLQRAGVNEFDFGNGQVAGTGDLVQAFDPDTSFDDVMLAISNYRPYSSRMTDNGRDFVEVQDTIYIDGIQTKVSYLCSRGENGFGTLVKVMVRSVTCAIRGEVKTFLGFGDLKSYKERFVVE